MTNKWCSSWIRINQDEDRLSVRLSLLQVNAWFTLFQQAVTHCSLPAAVLSADLGNMKTARRWVCSLLVCWLVNRLLKPALKPQFFSSLRIKINMAAWNAGKPPWRAENPPTSWLTHILDLLSERGGRRVTPPPLAAEFEPTHTQSSNTIPPGLGNTGPHSSASCSPFSRRYSLQQQAAFLSRSLTHCERD